MMLATHQKIKHKLLTVLIGFWNIVKKNNFEFFQLQTINLTLVFNLSSRHVIAKTSNKNGESTSWIKIRLFTWTDNEAE